MECSYFGVCGSCKIYQDGYQSQLNYKINKIEKEFGDIPDLEIFSSPPIHYRARAEFRIIHDGNRIHYGMWHRDGSHLIAIDSCPIVSEAIFNYMPKLKEEIAKSPVLSQKLFSIEFLSNRKGDIVVTLIYHRKLDSEWKQEAEKLSNSKISVIGRSRGVKITIGKEYIDEVVEVGEKKYILKHLENSFSQPNPFVNEKMVNWAVEQTEKIEKRDLLIELYCGSGNFTIPLSSKFRRVIATEIAKSGIATAKENIERNGIENIELGRVSSSEFVEAIDGKREFFRLRDMNLKNIDLETLLVDPPRAGLDSTTLEFASRFQNIIYISCNPETLKRDLEGLQKTHKIASFALFDQFPYTPHIESGVLLKKVLDT